MNVRLAGKTDPSVGSLDDSRIITLAVGCVLSFTVKVAVPPASVVTKPEVGLTVIPAFKYKLKLIYPVSSPERKSASTLLPLTTTGTVPMPEKDPPEAVTT